MGTSCKQVGARSKAFPESSWTPPERPLKGLFFRQTYSEASGDDSTNSKGISTSVLLRRRTLTMGKSYRYMFINSGSTGPLAVPPNPALRPTAGKRRLPVPASLRSSAAAEVTR